MIKSINDYKGFWVCDQETIEEKYYKALRLPIVMIGRGGPGSSLNRALDKWSALRDQAKGQNYLVFRNLRQSQPWD